MNVLNALQEGAQSALHEYAESRKRDVSRGAETAELAALLVEKFGEGAGTVLKIAEDLLDGPHANLRTEVDRLVQEIDPFAAENRQKRWAARPAAIALAAPDDKAAT